MFGFKRERTRYEYDRIPEHAVLFEGLAPLSICVNNRGDLYAFLEETKDGTVKVVWYRQREVKYYGKA